MKTEHLNQGVLAVGTHGGFEDLVRKEMQAPLNFLYIDGGGEIFWILQVKWS